MSDHYDNTGITGRAWFKPLVALWFGALAAAGMWFMPPDVHGSIVSATRLDRVHPIFNQPLDQTGTLALCAIAGLLGLLIGLLIAWRIAVASAPRAFAPGFEVHDDHDWADSQASDEEFEQPRRRRVFSAREDIGEQGIAVTAPEDENDYEDEYTIDDIPEVTPEEDFETVYAGLEEDYTPVEGEHAFDELEDPAPLPQADYAEFEEVEEVEADEEVVEPLPSEVPEEDYQPATPEPQPETAEQSTVAASPPPPISSEIPLGDMSLDGLLDRLEGALEKHSRMVGASERAAREPAPRVAPMRPAPGTAETETFADNDEETQGLPEVSDDDPVIAFLRREANRRMPGAQDEPADAASGKQRGEKDGSGDPQAALRSALDRLGQTGHRD